MPREIITLQLGQCGNQSKWLLVTVLDVVLNPSRIFDNLLLYCYIRIVADYVYVSDELDRPHGTDDVSASSARQDALSVD